jgi:hypothetical protein
MARLAKVGGQINTNNNSFNLNTNNVNNNSTKICQLSASKSNNVSQPIRGVCEINNNVVRCVADTACSVTTISETVAKYCNARIYSTNKSVKVANGNSEGVIGFAMVNFRLGNLVTYLEVLVIGKLVEDCLLGQDLLGTHSEIKHIYHKYKEYFTNTFSRYRPTPTLLQKPNEQYHYIPWSYRPITQQYYDADSCLVFFDINNSSTHVNNVNIFNNKIESVDIEQQRIYLTE